MRKTLQMENDVSNKLDELVKMARSARMTPEEKEEQRRSFVYGNTKIENDRITRELVDDVANKISENGAKKS